MMNLISRTETQLVGYLHLHRQLGDLFTNYAIGDTSCQAAQAARYGNPYNYALDNAFGYDDYTLVNEVYDDNGCKRLHTMILDSKGNLVWSRSC